MDNVLLALGFLALAAFLWRQRKEYGAAMLATGAGYLAERLVLGPYPGVPVTLAVGIGLLVLLLASRAAPKGLAAPLQALAPGALLAIIDIRPFEFVVYYSTFATALTLLLGSFRRQTARRS